MRPGVNVNPLYDESSPDPFMLKTIGIGHVVMVMRDDDRYRAYADTCNAADLAVVGVIARESGGYYDGRAAAIVVGNEPDLSSSSSWTRTPAQYFDDWQLYEATIHGADPSIPLVAAAMASGVALRAGGAGRVAAIAAAPDAALFGWWQQLNALGPLNNCAGVAVHPYGKNAAAAQTLIRSYKRVTPNLPVWVTEWNRPVAEILAFSAMLRTEAVEHAFYSWPNMEPGFGLSDQGRRLLVAA